MSTRESGRVLKADSLRGLGSRVVFDFEDVQRRCEERVAAARTEAAELLAHARAEAERIRSAAHEEGRSAGLESGLSDAETEIGRRAEELGRTMIAAEVESLRPMIANVAESLASERNRWIASWESQVVDMVVAVAERIVRSELATRPERARGLLEDVLQLVAAVDRVVVRMHPEDVELLGESAEQLVAGLARCGEAVVVADVDVTRGGCVVDTRHGTIDARIETQLARVAEELRGTRVGLEDEVTR